MPEAGRTPSADFKRGGNNLDYGQAGAANDLLGLVAPPEPEPFAPASEEEEFLYSSTDRPDEPITAGVPFGPGPDGTRHATESPQDFKRRLVSQLASQPGAPQEVRAFIARIERGE